MMRLSSIGPENSVAAGFGFRCGFLGLLHMEIIQAFAASMTSINFRPIKCCFIGHPRPTWRETRSAQSDTPDVSEIEFIEEPMILASIHIPSTSIGDVWHWSRKTRDFARYTETIDSQRDVSLAIFRL
jgi:GTP-binding protein LepA